MFYTRIQTILEMAQYKFEFHASELHIAITSFALLLSYLFIGMSIIALLITKNPFFFLFFLETEYQILKHLLEIHTAKDQRRESGLWLSDPFFRKG